MMLNKLDPEHIKFMGTEVEVDSDHFMAQGHVSTFSGVRNADQFDEWLRNEELDENTSNSAFNSSESDDVMNENISNSAFNSSESDDVMRSGLNEELHSDSSIQVR